MVELPAWRLRVDHGGCDRLIGNARPAALCPAQALQPHGRARERHSHLKAAAFPPAAGERHDRAEGGEITCRVVGSGGREEARAIVAMLGGDACDGLRALLPSREPLPWPFVGGDVVWRVAVAGQRVVVGRRA